MNEEKVVRRAELWIDSYKHQLVDIEALLAQAIHNEDWEGVKTYLEYMPPIIHKLRVLDQLLHWPV